METISTFLLSFSNAGMQRVVVPSIIEATYAGIALAERASTKLNETIRLVQVKEEGQ
jgi:hypothetical protein